MRRNSTRQVENEIESGDLNYANSRVSYGTFDRCYSADVCDESEDEVCVEEEEQAPDRPIPSSSDKAREINIKPLNYGYIIEIGCQTFAIETPDKLTEYLNKYLKDPNTVESDWLGKRMTL